MYCDMMCIVLWNALWYDVHCGLACIGNVMHYDMTDMCVDVSTPGGDCADRPPGAYVWG